VIIKTIGAAAPLFIARQGGCLRAPASGCAAEICRFVRTAAGSSRDSDGRGGRQPELFERASGVFGILGAECVGGLRRLTLSAGEGEGGHQEELRAAIAGVAFKRFMEQRNGRFGAAEEELGR
jgi:hypothetical protein